MNTYDYSNMYHTEWSNMIKYETVLSLPFLKKSRFTGSERGMRFCLKMIKKEEVSLLEASICPGPFSTDMTDPALFVSAEFPFTEEGKNQAVDWMNAQYEERKSFFEEVYEQPFRFYKLHHRKMEKDTES